MPVAAIPVHPEDHSLHIGALIDLANKNEERIEKLEDRMGRLSEHELRQITEINQKLDALSRVLTPHVLEELVNAVRVFKWTKGLGSIIFWMAMVSSGVALTWSSGVEIVKYYAQHVLKK